MIWLRIPPKRDRLDVEVHYETNISASEKRNPPNPKANENPKRNPVDVNNHYPFIL
jgi:hypothetical protein